MKIAKSTQLYKNGYKQLIYSINYKTHQCPYFHCSKIIEKLCVLKFDAFLEKNKLLSENPYRFRTDQHL